jgi:hypothetical protein
MKWLPKTIMNWILMEERENKTKNKLTQRGSDSSEDQTLANLTVDKQE